MSVLARYSDLAGRRTLVTGASSGIGLGIAEAMLDQGMEVALQYRSGRAAAEALCARFPGRAVNLSVNGVLIDCQQALEVGDDLLLAFDLPGDQGTVRATGTVVVGDEVHVTGVVKEYNSLTEIDSVAALKQCGAGTVAATTVNLPEATNGDLERYEGMLVTIPQTLTVAQNYFQGRYGQVTLASGGRLYNPTNLFAAGSPQFNSSFISRKTASCGDSFGSIQPPNKPHCPAETTSGRSSRSCIAMRPDRSSRIITTPSRMISFQLSSHYALAFFCG